jgi:hypothetical protein
MENTDPYRDFSEKFLREREQFPVAALLHFLTPEMSEGSFAELARMEQEYLPKLNEAMTKGITPPYFLRRLWVLAAMTLLQHYAYGLPNTPREVASEQNSQGWFLYSEITRQLTDSIKGMTEVVPDQMVWDASVVMALTMVLGRAVSLGWGKVEEREAVGFVTDLLNLPKEGD